jgi:gluconolactonase
MKPSNNLLNKAAQAIVLIMLGITFSCQQQAAIEQSEKEINKLVQRFIELINTGNLSLVDEICTPDVVSYYHGKKAPNVGSIAVKQFVEGHRVRYPDVNIEIDEMIIKNDKVVCRYTYTATLTGPGKLPPPHKSVTYHGVYIYKVVNGKIAEIWEYWDHQEKIKQLGFTITPPSTTSEKQVITAGPTAGLDDLVESGAPERIATGFSFTEGPVWHPDGYLLFSDITGNTINKWTPDSKVEVFRSPSGHANGLTFDRQGRLIACEHSNRRVTRTEPDGTIVTLADEYEGNKLNSPNDALVKSDGSIYFTDPPYGLTSKHGIPGKQELKFQGVYRLLPDGKTLELLVDDIVRPNGLVFSPDEKVLYVANSRGSIIYAFDVQPDGTLANRRVFVTLSGWADGIKVDMNGNLYVTTNKSVVRVYDSAGKHLGDIVTPEGTTNCAFGGPDNKTLFITARTSVYRVQLKVQGVPVDGWVR